MVAGLRRGLGVGLAVLLAGLVVLAAADTLSWLVLRRSSAAAREVEEVLLVWLALLSGAWGVGERLHLAVTLVSDRLPAGWRQATAVVARSAVVATGVLLAVYGARLGAAVGNVLPVTGLPAALGYWPAAVAGALIALFAALPETEAEAT